MSRPLAAAAWSVRTGPLRIWPGRAIFRGRVIWPVWAMLQRCDAAYYWSGRHTCRFACGSPPAGQASSEWKVSAEGVAGEELVELAGSHRNRADISGTLIEDRSRLSGHPDSLKISTDLHQRAHRSTKRTER